MTEQKDSASRGIVAIVLGAVLVPPILAFNASTGLGGRTIGLLFDWLPVALIGGGLATLWRVIRVESTRFGSAVRDSVDRMRVPTFDPDARDRTTVAAAMVIGTAVLTLFIGCITLRSAPFNGLTWGADGHVDWWPHGAPTWVIVIIFFVAICWLFLSTMLVAISLDYVRPSWDVEPFVGIWFFVGYPAVFLLPMYT